MTTSSYPYDYLCIEGNLGAGKTTLTQLISEQYGIHCILEQFTDNPFLPHFYKNPSRYAFPVELFFLTERHKQLEQELIERDLFATSVVADYFFPKTLLFARHNLKETEFRMFQRMYEVLNERIPKPDLLVYLHRSADKLHQLIRDRDRNMEEPIDKSYLRGIQDSYFTYFRTSPEYPILILDIEDLDFQKDEDQFHWIDQLLHQSFEPGIHRIQWPPESG